VSFLYLVALLTSLVGIGLLDFRHRLAFFGGAAFRSGLIIVLVLAFFLAWDVVGIATGVFFRGSGPWMTGILLAPELPLEEVFFLMVLAYSTLVSYLWANKALASKAPA
jgi:lycopene cyclase domain-containing protein